MNILVINSGSSSIKYKLFLNDTIIYEGIKEEISSHYSALQDIFNDLNTLETINGFKDIDAVGHRVVHGGDKFHDSVIIDDKTIDAIEQLIPLAPLHNKANLEAIKIIKEEYPNTIQTAVFDTAFHQTMPPSSYRYAIDKELYKKHHIKRYGFHGTSHKYVTSLSASFLSKDINKCNLITLHLGNGASATAVKNGKSIDTSMGFTPLAGLMMGTRCGDIDPAIVFYMEKQLNYDIDEIDTILNKQSGLKGICGESDLRKVINSANSGDKDAALALDMFIKFIKKYIGAYAVELGRVDAIVFTGGIGENSSYIREQVCKDLDQSIGAVLDIEKNNQKPKDISLISTDNSKIRILEIHTDEEKAIALETVKLL